jgi:predicted secreted protein
VEGGCKEIFMKLKDVITIDRASRSSTGYLVSLVKLEKLALLEESYTPSPSGRQGAAGTKHFTFLAIEAGRAEAQFATYRPWLLPKEIVYEDVLSFDVEPADDAEAADEAKTAGAADGAGAAYVIPRWTPFAAVSDEARKVFEEAMTGVNLIRHKPFAVTSQLFIGGTTYIFAANADILPASRGYPALIRVFKPVNGRARVTRIYNLGLPGAVGAFGVFHETSADEKDLLKQALAGRVGAGYEALLSSTQVVAGLNFRFIGTETLATLQADKYPALFTVYWPHSGGTPVFTGAQKVYDLV